MKPYGIKRKDHGCCPGHDKYPTETYAGRLSKKARGRDKALAHGVARQEGKRQAVNDESDIPTLE